jgi:hypothetical protein
VSMIGSRCATARGSAAVSAGPEAGAFTTEAWVLEIHHEDGEEEHDCHDRFPVHILLLSLSHWILKSF